jgi:hypothetical protein
MHQPFVRAGSLGFLCAVAAASAAGCARDYPFETIDVGPDVVIATVPPPPLSGGTLLVTADGMRAVAADPDRDVVWIVRLDERKLERKVVLEPGDEPGRVVEDGDGRVHVALRRAGAIVTLQPVTGDVLRRTPVCKAPRGIAADLTNGLLHVACAEGKLVTLDAATGEKVRSLSLYVDLRDVVVQGDRLLVTRFRSAEVLSIDAAGAIVSRGVSPEATLPDSNAEGGEAHFKPEVAWRTVAWPQGGVLMVHQRGKFEEVSTTVPRGYESGGGGCGSIVHAAMTPFGVSEDGTVLAPDQAVTTLPSVLPVDIAVSKLMNIAIAVAGSNEVLLANRDHLGIAAAAMCGTDSRFVEGTPTAVAFRNEEVVVQTRQPATLQLPTSGEVIALPGDSVQDTGFSLFHEAPRITFGDEESGETMPGGLACASCHPEGGEDGHVWSFAGVGRRRTQSLRGGVLETAPLHWDGDMEDMSAIMAEVFVKRMGGEAQGPVHARAIGRWVDAIPRLPAMREADDPAVLRGKEIFEGPSASCGHCHSGAHLTSNENADIGRSGALQVPSLVGVAWRGPFMHDGCAPTLLDRFDPSCGGDKHGNVSKLSADDLNDLVAYLESL